VLPGKKKKGQACCGRRATEIHLKARHLVPAKHSNQHHGGEKWLSTPFDSAKIVEIMLASRYICGGRHRYYFHALPIILRVKDGTMSVQLPSAIFCHKVRLYVEGHIDFWSRHYDCYVCPVMMSSAGSRAVAALLPVLDLLPLIVCRSLHKLLTSCS